MDKLNIFCFGFGQVAKSFINKISLEKVPFDLNITSRQKSEIFFNKFEYKSLNFNEVKFDKEILDKLKKSDHILISIPPVAGEDIVLKNFRKNLKNSKLKWLTYLSATSVYGNHNGGWVDEKSSTNPTSPSGIARLKAERDWIKFSKNESLPIQVFRLSGIYSNEYNILNRLRSEEIKIVSKKNHYFSRIHVEDIAGILFKSLNNFKTGEIYNISDDKPASNEDVTMYGVNLLKVEKPKSIEIKDIESEMLKNFYKDSKKVSNKKMKDIFKYKLKYPSYIEGLNYIKDNSI